jgi:hypothetical protein
MNLDPSHEIGSVLFDQAIALVEKATGGISNMRLVAALLEICTFLENSSRTDAPIVAIERDVVSLNEAYHLSVRRLSSSVPEGKFQIIITRELASGLIYSQNQLDFPLRSPESE